MGGKFYYGDNGDTVDYIKAAEFYEKAAKYYNPDGIINNFCVFMKLFNIISLLQSRILPLEKK